MLGQQLHDASRSSAIQRTAALDALEIHGDATLFGCRETPPEEVRLMYMFSAATVFFIRSLFSFPPLFVFFLRHNLIVAHQKVAQYDDNEMLRGMYDTSAQSKVCWMPDVPVKLRVVHTDQGCIALGIGLRYDFQCLGTM